MTITVPLALIDAVTLAVMALFFVSTLLLSLVAWRYAKSSPALARAMLAAAGVAIYLFLFFVPEPNMGGTERWYLRGIMGAYALPHLLASLDTILTHRKRTTGKGDHA